MIIDSSPALPLTRTDEGFTLIELLAVSVLLALLSTILYSSITAVLAGRELVTAQREVTLSAEHIFSRLNADLTARESVPLEQNDPQTVTPQAGGFSGFGVRRYLAAQNESKQDAAFDSIEFVTHSLPSNVISEVRNFGLVEVSYRLDEIPRTAQLEEEAGDLTRYRLLRQERPAAVRRSETRDAHEVTEILSDRVTSFNLRYLVNGKWQDEWTGTAGRAFPEAIELSLRLIDAEQQSHLYRTAVALSKRQN